jgi:hypothetical protein
MLCHDSAPLTQCRSHCDTYVVAVTPVDVNRGGTWHLLGDTTLPHAAAQQTFGHVVRVDSITDDGARSRSRRGR